MEGDDGESQDVATDCQAMEGEDAESQAKLEEDEADWSDAN